MAIWLKQSTAIDIGFGPFLDETDGRTVETALTITQADVRLKKNSGNWAQKNETTSATHEENGWYEIKLNATDTDTLGTLLIAVNESGALPVWAEFMVVPTNIWDSYFATDLLQVDLTQIGGNVVNTGLAQLGVNAVQIGTTAQSTGDANDRLLTLINNLDTVDNFLDTEIAAIKARTDNLPADTATVLTTIDDFLDTEVAAIKAKTDQLTFTTANQVDSTAITVSDKTGYRLDATGSAALTEGYATDGSTATLGQMLYMIWSALAEFSVSGTTITAKKLDGSTTAMTFTLDDGTSPTSRTRAS